MALQHARALQDQLDTRRSLAQDKTNPVTLRMLPSLIEEYFAKASLRDCSEAAASGVIVCR
jgi:hypothetical protein